MKHGTWRRVFHNCAYKYIDAASKLWQGQAQPRLCGRFLPIGKRCMYRICPQKESGLTGEGR